MDLTQNKTTRIDNAEKAYPNNMRMCPATHDTIWSSARSKLSDAIFQKLSADEIVEVVYALSKSYEEGRHDEYEFLKEEGLLQTKFK